MCGSLSVYVSCCMGKCLGVEVWSEVDECRVKVLAWLSENQMHTDV